MNNIIPKANNLPANIGDLSKFILFTREMLNAVKAEIKVIDRLDIAREVEKQKREISEVRKNASMAILRGILELIDYMETNTYPKSTLNIFQL